jgi:hypothetical protein
MATRTVLEDFDHFGGKHCESAALQKALAYRGLDVSEEMILGLGGGLGFIYWYMKMMASPLIGTRCGGKNQAFVKNACEHLGARVGITETGSAGRAYEELKTVLQEGEPAVVYGDMVYLPYMAMPEEAHFGGHCFVIYGIDEEADAVYISDRAKRSLSASLQDVAKARGSKHPPFPPKHRLLKISYPRMLTIRPDEVIKSIHECCRSMLNPPIQNIGISGIRKWAALVPKWPEQFSGLSLYGCLMNTYIYIEIGGTGGCAFRSMYAGFLEEAAGITGSKGLSEVAELFRRSAERWSTIARKAMPDSIPLLARARELIARKNHLFEEQGSEGLSEMLAINKELDGIHSEIGHGFDPTPQALADLSQEILLCAEAEQKAFEMLSRETS